MTLRGFIHCAAVLGLLASGVAAGETLTVRVVDPDRQPVADVVVFITQQESSYTPGPPGAAVMDQRDSRFVPHILIVQQGAEVSFPNSDVIAHHVYSFSRPNHFELPLYKGTPPEPVRFDHDGVVTLGCNIHDSMLGYIVVVDTDIFAMTGSDGIARLEVDADAGGWTVHAWSPRIRDSREPLAAEVRHGEPLEVSFALQKKLRAPHGDESESLLWNDY